MKTKNLIIIFVKEMENNLFLIIEIKSWYNYPDILNVQIKNRKNINI